jgi:transcriptional regulator with XRE-family HTH domain
MSIGVRIKKARTSAGYSQGELGKRVGAQQNTVSSWENDRTRPDDKILKRLAAVLETSFEALLGLTDSATREIPIVAYVGAGAEFLFIDDHELGGGLDTVEVPPGVSANSIAVMIRGESMTPAYYDGDILFYDETRPDIDTFLNRECVCRLADGRTLVKTPTRGSQDGLYTLISWNSAAITDVVLEWCARIEWVKKR